MPEPEIQLIDPALCDLPEDGNPADQEYLEHLLESLRRDGQKVPALLGPNPEEAARYLVIDGRNRCLCLARLGRKLKALVLPGPVSEAERIELKFQHNVIRRSMGLIEIAADAERYMELTGCTQHGAALKLNCSDATISRALTLIRRIPPEYRAVANQLGPSFVSLISPLKAPEAMGQAIAFATTPGPGGKKPARDLVARFVAELRGKRKARSPKIKRFKLSVDDRRIEIDLRPGDSPESLIEALKAALGRLTRNREQLLSAVAEIDAGHDQPAA